jgi:hypothetical protein
MRCGMESQSKSNLLWQNSQKVINTHVYMSMSSQIHIGLWLHSSIISHSFQTALAARSSPSKQCKGLQDCLNLSEFHWCHWNPAQIHRPFQFDQQL